MPRLHPTISDQQLETLRQEHPDECTDEHRLLKRAGFEPPKRGGQREGAGKKKTKKGKK